MSIDVEPATTKMPGFPRRFGPYVLVKPLARGGMGALYLALRGQAGMDKLCVVKTALPHLADRSYLQRFRDEAKVVVRLSHGNLVTVFDAGEARNEMFLAMDFVEGKDLRAVWNRCAQKGTAFPIPVAVHLVKELARGLAYAHSFEGLHLVHRDVSPPNVLISYSGEVKLTDFGLATSTLKLEKTAPGVIYGKVSYMSPEQARGEALDGRTDIYSAGVMLWEMLTGRQMFPPGGRDPAGTESEDDLLERVRRPQIVPPSQRTSRVPVELDAICARALAVDPAARYQTGEELRSELAAFLAKTAPATDGEQVARFLRDLFGNDIAKERAERETLLEGARRILGSGPEKTPRPITVAKAAVKPLVKQPGAPAGGQDHVRHSTTPISKEEASETHRRAKEGELSQLAGTILADRYHIKRLCGEGGMGRVYEAEHVEIGKRVAVKVLHPAYTRTPDVVERFRREARAASRIYHPNIVNVTDSGTVGDGSFFFVMEYIEGVELGFVIHREGPLAPARVLHVAAQMCDALQAAHDAGVIHRDLKPENILLVTPASPRSSSTIEKVTDLMLDKPVTPSTPQLPLDFVKVLDFGIAKSLDVEDESTRAGRRLTRPGVAMGTPEYMAPEQAAGKPADPRSDIYAVGSIMYEMLTAAPPYDGDNVMEVLHKKANELPKRIREVRPEVPAEVEALVERAMARTPDARPQSMAALAAEIRAVAANLNTLTPAPVTLPPRHNSPVFAGAIDKADALSPFNGARRRGLAVAAAAMVMLTAFVIVRAATSSKRAPGPVPTLGHKAPARPSPPPPAPLAPEPPPAFVGPRLPEADAPAEAPRVTTALPGRPRPAGLGPAPARQLLKNAQTMLKAQRYEEAGEAFKRLLGNRRERGPALVGLANIAFQKQNYADAVARAREASKAGGGIEAYLLLGDSLFKLGKYADAKTAYEDALGLRTGSESAKKRARAGLDLASRRMN
jgi:serine/threonine protein kinase